MPGALNKWLVARMALADNRAEEVPEDLVALGVPSHRTDGANHWVALAVHARLDALGEAHPARSAAAPEFPVDGRLVPEHLRHDAVVPREVRQLLGAILPREARRLGVAQAGDCLEGQREAQGGHRHTSAATASRRREGHRRLRRCSSAGVHAEGLGDKLLEPPIGEGLSQCQSCAEAHPGRFLKEHMVPRSGGWRCRQHRSRHGLEVKRVALSEVGLRGAEAARHLDHGVDLLHLRRA
mmetsp:Transcript_88065/g.196967  ORF Transcript_88065/g.196967 Transcript_88065/m.196967 type:complete len:239 (-) Transcript_88065:207-923(-)